MPSLLASADLETVQRLFTTIVRADRFSEGTLAEHVESGFVLELLRRVSQLADE